MHSIRRPQRYSCSTAQPFLVVVKWTEYPIVKWTNLAFIAPNILSIHLIGMHFFILLAPKVGIIQHTNPKISLL